jgi:tetratricopeptide (TPR) repeat protein
VGKSYHVLSNAGRNKKGFNYSYQADDLLTDLLKHTPDSPKLICLLADVRKDPKLYELAWEKSGNRFARAMRSLGAYYFDSKKWDLSVQCYSKALAINPMFENSWFVMGCAALRIDDFAAALSAFTRSVQLEPDVYFN